MSLRVLVALLFLIGGLIWTIRRPFVGICIVVALFHLNLRMFGAGLDEIRFQFVATIVLLISFVINQYKLQEPRSPLHTPMFALFAFLGVCYMTSAWAAASIPLAFESTVEFSKIVLFAFLMAKIIKTEKEVTILLWVMLICVWYTAFMVRWGVEWDWVDSVEAGIATGATGTHMLMFFPLLITLVLAGKTWEKIAALMIIPFILDGMTVLEGGYRSTFLTLVTATIVFLLLAPRKLRLRSLLPFSFGAVLFVFVLAPPGYFDYMKTILDPTAESSANSRNIINAASLEILQDYPFGVGYNNYSMISMDYIPEEILTDEGTRDAHNSYLKVATEFGVLGFILWITTFVLTYLYFRKVRKFRPKDQPPNRMQLYAFSLAIGLVGIAPGIWTHSYNDLDTLYWFIALSCVFYNIQYPPDEKLRVQNEGEKAKLSPAARAQMPPAPAAVVASRHAASSQAVQPQATRRNTAQPLDRR